MNDHQTQSVSSSWYKYWILIFLNTVKQSKLLVKKILMVCHPAQFDRNKKNRKPTPNKTIFVTS